ncbi:hypothetical protein CONPUDRAFT_99952 [Coniophora puteana RWD-64-598 SS2]|uniref:AP complex subunit beta n=1 Tax=Coniophora puteana (strain RWD-64-598) TaxID=741705 RepID=A0A5M3MYB8_CONPW|nr:uncharacterized protein CONPUDRAFT_99952 [Coniophora puteana RWD-64-598 SS2]EIW84132.1 hypothetical protein CONPUDRAFT_99952 [Coniophora puteana RWD-64-598 SS2]
MDSINLNAFAENASRLGLRIQESISEHTRDLNITRGAGNIFDMADDKVKNIGKQLDSSSDREKLDAMKRLIALISKGRNVSNYFPQVVKNVASQNLEIRKLVYIYLLRYAEQEPDLALLSINTFQKDLADPSPLIRAMALRVLSGIKVPMITSVVVLAIKKCAADTSPYVRKASALAIPKCYELDSSQQPTLITVIQSLLCDRSPLSIGSAVTAFEAVCPTRLDLLHLQYRRLCRILVDVDEWGQVDLSNLLMRYARTMLPKPIVSQDQDSNEEVDPDLQLLLSSAEPLLQSRNPAVVLAVTRVIYYCGPPSYGAKIVKPLLRLLGMSKAIERVTLVYIHKIVRFYPILFSSHYMRFFLRSEDAREVKKSKIQLLMGITTLDNYQAILRELIDAAEDVDDEVVGSAIHAIGFCVQLLPSTTPQCLSALTSLIKTKHDIVVSKAVVVLKSLVQNQLSSSATNTEVLQSPISIVSQLAKRVDDIRHFEAKACVIWLVGQYCATQGGSGVVEGVADWAPDVLRKSAKTFASENVTVKLQVLSLAAKLVALSPAHKTIGQISQYVFDLGRYDMNYDVRDRRRMLVALLSGISEYVTDEDSDATSQGGIVLRREQVIRVLIDGKAGVLEIERPDVGQHLIGSLSLVTGKDMQGDEILPEWLESGIDPSLRQVEEETTIKVEAPRAISSHRPSNSAPTPVVLTEASAHPQEKKDWRNLDDFYAENEEEGGQEQSEEEESDEEDEEESGDSEDEDEELGTEDSEETEDGESEDHLEHDSSNHVNHTVESI